MNSGFLYFLDKQIDARECELDELLKQKSYISNDVEDDDDWILEGETAEEIKAHNERLDRAKNTFESVVGDFDDGFIKRGSFIIKIKNPANLNEKLINVFLKLIDKLRGF